MRVPYPESSVRLGDALPSAPAKAAVRRLGLAAEFQRLFVLATLALGAGLASLLAHYASFKNIQSSVLNVLTLAPLDESGSRMTVFLVTFGPSKNSTLAPREKRIE